MMVGRHRPLPYFNNRNTWRVDANGFRIRAALALNSRAFLTFHWPEKSRHGRHNRNNARRMVGIAFPYRFYPVSNLFLANCFPGGKNCSAKFRLSRGLADGRQPVFRGKWEISLRILIEPPDNPRAMSVQRYFVSPFFPLIVLIFI